MLGIVQPQKRPVGLVRDHAALEHVGKALAVRFATEAGVAEHRANIRVFRQQIGMGAVPQPDPRKRLALPQIGVIVRRIERRAARHRIGKLDLTLVQLVSPGVRKRLLVAPWLFGPTIDPIGPLRQSRA